MTFGGKAKVEHHSDTTTFSVTSVGHADMKIENFSQSVTSCRPGTVYDRNTYLASYDIANRGNADDIAYVKYLYRTAGETTWHDLEGGVLQTPSIAVGSSISEVFPLFVTWTCPADGTTTDFAIKVWGKDTEGEPADPA